MAVGGRRASPFDFKRAWVEPPTVAKYYHSLALVTLILETEVLFQEAALRDGQKGVIKPGQVVISWSVFLFATQVGGLYNYSNT